MITSTYFIHQNADLDEVVIPHSTEKTPHGAKYGSFFAMNSSNGYPDLVPYTLFPATKRVHVARYAMGTITVKGHSFSILSQTSPYSKYTRLLNDGFWEEN